MLDVFAFVLTRMLRGKFWLFVGTGFFLVLLAAIRSELRNQFFQEASAVVGKRYS